MRSFFFFIAQQGIVFFTNAETTSPLTDRPVYWERPGCGSVFTVSRGGGQDNLSGNGHKSAPACIQMDLEELQPELICPWFVDSKPFSFYIIIVSVGAKT